MTGSLENPSPESSMEIWTVVQVNRVLFWTWRRRSFRPTCAARVTPEDSNQTETPKRCSENENSKRFDVGPELEIQVWDLLHQTEEGSERREPRRGYHNVLVYPKISSRLSVGPTLQSEGKTVCDMKESSGRMYRISSSFVRELELGPPPLPYVLRLSKLTLLTFLEWCYRTFLQTIHFLSLCIRLRKT